MINDKNAENRKNAELRNKLYSDNHFVIIEALKEIKENGTINIIPCLFDLINEKTSDIIKKDILRLICDIKEQSAAPVLIDAISTRNFGEDTACVIATFWQSRLDFSSYLPTFIKIFIKEDYQTAIEAFTVIEESVSKISNKMQQECISILNSAADSITQEKKPLYRELVKVIAGPGF
ncbi:MAG: hypothetical protein JSV22_10985 [Bacteroidales bacterium]|nr:MAG: hypothetical protein JSV22_10985 [Bacteroidales bacterium]